MPNTFTIRIFTLMAGLALLGTPLAAQGGKLRLEQAVAAALEHNPAQKLAAADLAEASAGYRLSRTMLYPQISFSEGITRGTDPVFAFGTKLRQQVFQSSDFALNSLNRPAPLNNVTTGFSGRWTAFDSWGTQWQIRRARLLRQSVRQAQDRSGQQVIFGVISAYESVLAAQREVEVAQHVVETAQALYDLSRTRVGAGLAVESDALSAQVNLAARQQELIQAQGALQADWAGLEAATGVALPPQELEPLKERQYALQPIAEELEQALKSRPDLAGIAMQISAQQTAVKAAKAEYGPRIDAFGSWQDNRQSFSGNGGNNWMAGAELRVDLTPFGKRENVQMQKATLLRAQAGEEAAHSQVRVEVSRAYYTCQAAAKSVEVARDARAQAAESLRILRNRYEAGLVNITELLRAEDAVRMSEKNYWQTVSRNAVSYAALRLATGTLNQDQVVNFQ